MAPEVRSCQRLLLQLSGDIPEVVLILQVELQNCFQDALGDSAGAPLPFSSKEGQNYEKVVDHWLDVLRRLPSVEGGIPGRISDCQRWGWRWVDSQEHVDYTPKSCQLRHDCPKCGDTESRLRGQVAMETFREIAGKVGGLSLVHMVFTLPRDLWGSVDYDTVIKFFKVVRRTLEKYFLEQGRVAPLMTFHPGSPKTANKNPHIDLVFLNLAYHKTADKEIVQSHFDGSAPDVILSQAGFRRVSPYIDVDRLQQAYQDELDRAYGTDVPVNPPHCQYIPWNENRKATADKLWHVVSYGVRYFVRDAYQATMDGVEWTERDLKTLDYLLHPPSHFKRSRWCGWLSDSTRSERLALLGIVWRSVETMRAEILGAGHICRKCGEEMERADELFHDLMVVGHYRRVTVYTVDRAVGVDYG